MEKFARLFHGMKKAAAPQTSSLRYRPKAPCLQYTFLWADSFIALNLNTLRTGKVSEVLAFVVCYASPYFWSTLKSRIIDRRKK